MTASPMVSGPLASLDRRTGTRRAEGVRRTDDLDGWARVLGEGIRQSEGAA